MPSLQVRNDLSVNARPLFATRLETPAATDRLRRFAPNYSTRAEIRGLFPRRQVDNDYTDLVVANGTTNNETIEFPFQPSTNYSGTRAVLPPKHHGAFVAELAGSQFEHTRMAGISAAWQLRPMTAAVWPSRGWRAEPKHSQSQLYSPGFALWGQALPRDIHRPTRSLFARDCHCLACAKPRPLSSQTLRQSPPHEVR